MRLLQLSLAATASLLLGGAGLGSTAQAMPGHVVSSEAPAAVTLVSEGCGPRFHRGPRGGCRPNGFFVRHGFGGRPPFDHGYHRNF